MNGNLPAKRLIRLPEVLKMFPICATSFWAGVKAGLYPEPVKLGSRARAWRLSDIEALVENPPQMPWGKKGKKG